MTAPDIPAPISANSAAAHRGHAEFRAARNGIGIGVAVTHSAHDGRRRSWQCIVTDGRDWHYITVLGPFGSNPALSPGDIEHGVEGFAATLAVPYRLYGLLMANPLHIDADGTVRD
jgi:hypothetical protein